MVAGAVIIKVNANIPPVRRTCSSSAQLSKGSILTLSSPNTAANTAVSAVPGSSMFAGIAAADKDPTNTSTTIACHMNGTFDCFIGKAATTGQTMMMSSAQILTPTTSSANGSLSGGLVVGVLEEDASAGEVCRVRLGQGGSI